MQKLLKQKFALSYITQLALQLVSLITGVFVARIAGPMVLGTLTFSLAYAGTFSFLLGLGLGSAHLRLVASGKPLESCLGTYVRLVIPTIIVYLLVSFGSVLWQFWKHPGYFESTAALLAVVLAILSTTVGVGSGVFSITYNAQIKQAKADIPKLAVGILDNFGRLAIVLIGMRVLGLSIWWLVISVVTFVLYFAIAKDFKLGAFDKNLAGEYIKIAIPLFLLGFVNSQMYNLDKVILKYLSSDVQVGYYGASFRLGGFIQLIGASLGTIFFPLFSKAITQKDYGYVKDKIHQFERFSDTMLLPLVMAVVIYSDLIVKLILGKQYYPSIIPMSIITIALYISVQTVPYMNVVTGAGRFYRVSLLTTIPLLTLILALIAFIHPNLFDLKATGAALSVLLSNIVGSAVFRIAAKREVTGLETMRCLPLWIISMGLALVFYIANSYLAVYGFIAQAISGILFLALIYFILWKAKYIGSEEYQMLKSILNPASTLSYIKNELTN